LGFRVGRMNNALRVATMVEHNICGGTYQVVMRVSAKQPGLDRGKIAPDQGLLDGSLSRLLKIRSAPQSAGATVLGLKHRLKRIFPSRIFRLPNEAGEFGERIIFLRV